MSQSKRKHSSMYSVSKVTVYFRLALGPDKLIQILSRVLIPIEGWHLYKSKKEQKPHMMRDTITINWIWGWKSSWKCQMIAFPRGFRLSLSSVASHVARKPVPVRTHGKRVHECGVNKGVLRHMKTIVLARVCVYLCILCSWEKDWLWISTAICYAYASVVWVK